MNPHEKNLYQRLLELKNKYHVVGVKVEFETECIAMKEAILLKEITKQAGLEFSVKLGGCSSLKDMYEAKVLSADKIIAPLVESEYAMHKYIEIAKSVFGSSKNIKLLLNIETFAGYKSCENILDMDLDNDIYGVVFGRNDFIKSLQLYQHTNVIASEEILKCATEIAQITKNYQREFTIGGGISPDTIAFFKKMPPKLLNKFETRKIIFDAQAVMNDENGGLAILKAIEFELLWLGYKHDVLKIISKEDDKRVEQLLARYNNCTANCR